MSKTTKTFDSPSKPMKIDLRSTQDEEDMEVDENEEDQDMLCLDKIPSRAALEESVRHSKSILKKVAPPRNIITRGSNIFVRPLFFQVFCVSARSPLFPCEFSVFPKPMFCTFYVFEI